MMTRRACLATIGGTFIVSAVAPARLLLAASPPVWSHPKYTVRWTNMQFLTDAQTGLDYAAVDLVDNAGNLVGTCKDTYHADFEEWEYAFYWPRTTDIAGSFYIPRATEDPHASANRAIPGPAEQLYHFVGEVTEATGVFSATGAMPWVGAQAEMHADVGRDGSFGCICTHTAPSLR